MRYNKVKSRDELIAVREAAGEAGTSVGFTSGTFDLVHAGHVTILQEAKGNCDLLIVGVNSDESVKSYKGPGRPIRDEQDRLLVIAALEAVDFVFLFDEPNTNESVRLLKPDIYFKGGDYAREMLSSAPLVEAYGGETKILSLVPHKSTSEIIRRIAEAGAGTEASAIRLPRPPPGPAVFLDRDGTLNEHIDYLHDPHRLRIFPGALSAIGAMRESGYRVVVVTNQPGIGIGYFSEDDFFRVNKQFLGACSKEGVLIDRVYFCPHSKGDECRCRKPEPGMIERAVDELNIDVAKSYVVGDMTSDVALGKAVGAKTILVRTGYGGGDALYDVQADYTVDSIVEAAGLIIRFCPVEPSLRHGWSAAR